MAKVELNSLVNGIRGQVDNVVLRKYKGRTILGRKPSGGQEPTAAQSAHQERFRLAVNWGKSVMVDETLRPLYEIAAQRQEIPVFAACIADYFNAPTIDSVDASQYHGNVGDALLIVASDDFGVNGVSVLICDEEEGTEIESGQAVESAPGSGRWTYITTAQAAVGSTVILQVTATDRPGGVTVQRGTKRL